ncbi:MAG: Peptide antibiotic transporter SbmA [Alphaproteobacteria bacterium MarineAlpha5_Bin11]|nr:transporter [Pelagibacteraceae bacterium]PPR42956.1 MAG: Peptide antibiotic transporter SbmA [Alphaproteobacteria bacterium MarineAlpha5_Bin11]PPR51552.1 MAG: Peptide antibiotic transporter SbmA [Alphaproteobacteria bacterium MarineAlpha5_Bin10]|tara:strand:- start:11166 stop:12209 length:1044 start_codon:yes stop_codon:yes gene_type:complete
MIKAFYYSKKWALWAYGGGFLLILSLWLQVQMTVALNAWYKDFYDLIQSAADYKDNSQEGISLFFSKIVSLDYISGMQFEGTPSFLVIAAPYIVLAVFTSWFTAIYGLRWREAMTFSYIPKWKNVKKEIEGASQRIQEDCYRFARIVESLGLQIVRATMTLIAFLPILWNLSVGIVVPFIGDMEGSLVYVSLIVSLGGIIISWIVGIKLPGLEYNNQKVEAAFRKDLVLGEDDKIKYAKPERLFELFTGIRMNYHRLFLHTSYFNFWLNLYDQFMSIALLLVMGPGLFTGVITFGVLIQANNAFDRVHNSFNIILYNWTTITELRSIWKRLYEFERNLDMYLKVERA